MAPRSGSLPLDGPFPLASRPNLSLVGGTNSELEEERPAIHIPHEDGSVTISWGDDDEETAAEEEKESNHDDNLALKMDDAELATIASELIQGITTDIDSRSEWLETRARGIELLGLKLEKPKSDASGSSSAPLEGMSNVRHPLLLDATIHFQATARGELLPAAGPVKVRNDSPPPPKSMMGHNGGPPIDSPAADQLAEATQDNDELATALEKDLNHYLTYIATEYVPDTDRMLFYIGFGGDGFKKVYNCPLRRRVVSESVDAENLVVSNSATDMYNASRITHIIKMRKSVLRRMQIMGVYRDIDLSPPSPPPPNPVEKKKEDLSGQKTSTMRPEDRDYEIYETCCELDIDQFAPKQFKGKALPLPYRVTLESQSHKILAIHRNWKEDDDECCAKRYYVQFPFIRGLGFYGLGYIHILGNTTNALTAAWRELLDKGMFANFPGFLFAKGLGRQNTNQFRVPPGGGVPIDVPPGMSIKDAVMNVPYGDIGPAFVAFIQHIEEQAKGLAATANINVGEGKQEAPVGTTLALIEQASKIIDSAHKRLHAAQAEEFKLLKERFREDPEAFWRHNKKPTVQWQKDQFIQALNTCELVPVADPNNPTQLHRIAKAMLIAQRAKEAALLYDPLGVEMRLLKTAEIDPNGLFRPTPAQPPPDPRMEAIQQKAASQDKQSQIQLLETQIKAATQAAAINDKAQDRASREKIEQMKIELEKLKIEEEKIIHANDAIRETQKMAQQLGLEQQAHAQKMQLEANERAQGLHGELVTRMQEAAHDGVMREQEHRQAGEHHQAEMARADRTHFQNLEQDREKHQHKLQSEKELAEVKKDVLRAQAKAARSKPKGKS